MIKSSALNNEERRNTARAIGQRLSQSTTPAHVILTKQGIEEWDKPGEPAYDPEGLQAFLDEMRKVIKPPIQLSEINAHINDQEFADKALEIFDHWVADGTVKKE